MSDATYDNQIITQYLLGSLTDAESDRLDELSVVNDEFVLTINAVENDLVDAYVHGELRGEDLERFRSFYLRSPLRREKVAFAQAFQTWFENKALQTDGAKPVARVPRRAGSWFSGLSIFSAHAPAWQWGFAVVGLILLIAGGVLLMQNLRLRQQITQTEARREELLHREQELLKQVEAQRAANSQTAQELAQTRAERAQLEEELKKRAVELPREGEVVALVLTPPMRGAGEIPGVTIRPETKSVNLTLKLEASDYPAYRVALIDAATNRTLWRSGSLKAGAGAINLTLPASLLKAQNHRLQLSGVTASGTSEIVSDYAFKVVR
jgi:hypothetical protein